ncbi:MAG: FkbM family methyltransferase [Vicinamibacterales bacterium]
MRAGLRGGRDAAAGAIATLIVGVPSLEPVWAWLGPACLRVTAVDSLYRSVVDRVVASHLRAGRSTCRTLCFPHGRLRLDVADFTTKWLYFGGRMYEPATTRFIASALSPGDTFLDVGAHHGYYTQLAASVVGEDGRVIAFEPMKHAREALERLSEENDFSERVQVVAAAIGAAQGRATFFVYPGHDAFSSLVPPTEIPAPFIGTPAPVTVPVDTLDRWTERLHPGQIHGVKIDVEKAELGVLDGMREMLAKRPPAWIVCETEWEGPAHRRLVAAGYRASVLDWWGPGHGNILFRRPGRRDPAEPVEA